ncbi:MAG: GNAT family N-acetyltransferase [Trebonia sp.]
MDIPNSWKVCGSPAGRCRSLCPLWAADPKEFRAPRSGLQTELAAVTAWKASVGHRIVGAVRARVAGTVLHVGRLTVAPDWQGGGIGSRLLTAVESHHGEQVDTAALFTGHLSEANLSMYTRRGYSEQRREPLSPGVLLVHLTKPLPATDGPAR